MSAITTWVGASIDHLQRTFMRCILITSNLTTPGLLPRGFLASARTFHRPTVCLGACHARLDTPHYTRRHPAAQCNESTTNGQPNSDLCTLF